MGIKEVENSENALLAVVMDSLAEKQGEDLFALNEKLKADKSAAISEKVNKKHLRTIDKAFNNMAERELNVDFDEMFEKLYLIPFKEFIDLDSFQDAYNKGFELLKCVQENKQLQPVFENMSSFFLERGYAPAEWMPVEIFTCRKK